MDNDEIIYPNELDHDPAFDSFEEEQDELYALHDFEADPDRIYLGSWDGEPMWRNKNSFDHIEQELYENAPTLKDWLKESHERTAREGLDRHLEAQANGFRE